MHIRGELCVGAASLFSFAAVLLLVFTHIGQIKPSSVPRSIALVKIDVSAYGLGLEAATGDPTPGLYNTTEGAPLGQLLGLRQVYKWGLYSNCGYNDPGGGVCTNLTMAHRFKPAAVILGDTPGRYTVQTRELISSLPSIDDSIMTTAAYYMVLIGSILALITFLLGLIKTTLTFLVAFIFAGISSAMLIVAGALWTSIIQKTNLINSIHVVTGPSLGIRVDFDIGLWLIWAAAVCMFLSIMPYLVSCCTFRR
ncbi:actin cortical patch SUR7/pH-response regulator pali [Auriculariales sp. MPI-PUGE-AT-0066]|nr:actin cortical patch SUR7/pH-response regulator pali [Auriculariales sp. MPI-PUGE-AT-0066]